MSRKPKIDMTAPIASVDLLADGHEIWPCLQCYPWHAEVVRDPETNEVLLREWHAAECPALVELLAAEPPDGS